MEHPAAFRTDGTTVIDTGREIGYADQIATAKDNDEAGRLLDEAFERGLFMYSTLLAAKSKFRQSLEWSKGDFSGPLKDFAQQLITEHNLRHTRDRALPDAGAWNDFTNPIRAYVAAELRKLATSAYASPARATIGSEGLRFRLSIDGGGGTTAAIEQDASPAAGESNLWNELTPNSRKCLRAMSKLKATTEGELRCAEDIANAAIGIRDRERVARNLSELKKRGLVHVQRGSGGGYWLSKLGLELVNSNK